MNDMGAMLLPFVAEAPRIAGAFEQLVVRGIAIMANAVEQRQRETRDLDPDRLERLRGERYLTIRGSW